MRETDEKLSVPASAQSLSKKLTEKKNIYPAKNHRYKTVANNGAFSGQETL